MIKFPRQRNKVGKWISHQRTAFSLGELSQKQIKKLELLPGWTWNAQIGRWDAIYEELISFTRKNKRLPLQYGKNKHEKILGTWVQNRRRDHRGGKLPQERVNRLEQVPGWCWNALSVAWDSLYNRTLTFVKENGRLPSRHTLRHSPEERILGTWSHTQRGRYRDQKLPQKRIKNIEQIPGWSWSLLTNQWDSTYEQVLDFVKKYKRFPSKNNPKEKSLCFWNSTQRIKKRKLSRERSRKLEQIPGWSWNVHDDNWLAKYKKLTIFVRKRKKLPSQTSRDPEESIVGNWVATQRSFKKKDSISKERIVKLEQIPGWFWTQERKVG